VSRGPALAAGALVALAAATPASAHTASGLPGGFGAGFAHPFGGLDHLLAMVSVGLWGAILGRPLVYALPVAFPLMMVAGALLAMFGVPLPSVELGVALSALVLGACVALAVRAPAWLAVAMVAVFAVFHGYAHGRELPSAADPMGYAAGFVLATGLLHLSGVAVGAFSDRPAGWAATRALGGVVAVGGIWFLARAVTV
jgi:urease accessory protein